MNRKLAIFAITIFTFLLPSLTLRAQEDDPKLKMYEQLIERNLKLREQTEELETS